MNEPIETKPTFEESIGIIDREIAKRRSEWTLQALPWIDYDDVAQIIRIHILKKWDMWDHTKPLSPWLSTVIKHQIINTVRNIYSNCNRPCLKCDASRGDECIVYENQCNTCPIYAYWEKHKKNAYNIKVPVSLEFRQQEVLEQHSQFIDFDQATAQLHQKMKSLLKPLEWKVYRLLYIEHKSDEETARLMGFKTNEKNRMPGYKRIKQIKKTIVERAKKLLYDGDVRFSL